MSLLRQKADTLPPTILPTQALNIHPRSRLSFQEPGIDPSHYSYRDMKQRRVGAELSIPLGTGMQVDCVTCKWMRWSASIPLILLLPTASAPFAVRLGKS